MTRPRTRPYCSRNNSTPLQKNARAPRFGGPRATSLKLNRSGGFASCSRRLDELSQSDNPSRGNCDHKRSPDNLGHANPVGRHQPLRRPGRRTHLGAGVVAANSPTIPSAARDVLIHIGTSFLFLSSRRNARGAALVRRASRTRWRLERLSRREPRRCLRG